MVNNPYFADQSTLGMYHGVWGGVVFHLLAYGSPQAQGPIGAVAASLHHSHSNTRSELHVQLHLSL